jgi:hypothetical protein
MVQNCCQNNEVSDGGGYLLDIVDGWLWDTMVVNW